MPGPDRDVEWLDEQLRDGEPVPGPRRPTRGAWDSRLDSRLGQLGRVMGDNEVHVVDERGIVVAVHVRLDELERHVWPGLEPPNQAREEQLAGGREDAEAHHAPSLAAVLVPPALQPSQGDLDVQRCLDEDSSGCGELDASADSSEQRRSRLALEQLELL